LRRWFQRSLGDELRAASLVLPAAALAGVLLIAPLGLLAAQSLGSPVGEGATLANYGRLFSVDGIHYWRLMLRSLTISAIATTLVLALAYPAAYFLAFGSARSKTAWLIALIVPFWISYLLRIFSWKVVLGFNGVINSGLKSLGLIDQPIEALLYNPVAVTLTLAHSWSAFAVLPIYVSLQKIDRSLFEASADLGDNGVKRFLRVTLPLSMPGVVGAFVLVFVPVMGDYITPQLVGGTSGVMIGSAIASLFGKEQNPALGAALSIVMMAVIALVVAAVVGLGRLAGATRRAGSAP
jgi:spermidine/putrescine transport system permease protein